MWVAASCWIVETRFGLTTTYFFCRRTGRMRSSTRASASATFFRRSSPRTSETTLGGRGRRLRPDETRPRHRGARHPRRKPQESPTRHARNHHHPPPAYTPPDDDISRRLFRRPGGRSLPGPRLRRRSRLDAAGRGPQLRPRDALRLHERQLRGLLRLRLHAHEGRHLRERGGRPARDRRLRDGRPRPGVGLLRHEPRPALPRRADRLRRPGAAPPGHLREGPSLPRDRGEPGQGPPGGAAGLRDGARAAPARPGRRAGGGGVVPGGGPRARTRSASCRRASSACAS